MFLSARSYEIRNKKKLWVKYDFDTDIDNVTDVQLIHGCKTQLCLKLPWTLLLLRRSQFQVFEVL